MSPPLPFLVVKTCKVLLISVVEKLLDRRTAFSSTDLEHIDYGEYNVHKYLRRRVEQAFGDPDSAGPAMLFGAK